MMSMGCKRGKLDIDHVQHLEEKYKQYAKGEIDYSLNQTQKVWRISISNIPLKKIPSEICDLDALTMISLHNTEINQVPEICNSNKVETLHLTNSQISGKVTLPKSFARLKVLRLYSFKAKINNIYFPKDCLLEQIYLMHNDLKTINDSFSNLKKVKKLYLDGNKFKDIDLRSLKTLKTVYLYNNPIKDTTAIKLRHKGVKFYF
ncbi:internalin B, i-InlB2 protein [Microscilla marina ATCC 23134]|uniref:Internalin B, i-InlB2 protein n=2 Tax=Microscilla marina TaxID=1027 RepID=A1ZZV9_MICM2|nr:internalin B, i-InlB2 protein [Microscilla marina ATCC 23134]